MSVSSLFSGTIPLWVQALESRSDDCAQVDVPRDALLAQAAFDVWLQTRQPALRVSSSQIYRWIWGKFVRSMAQQGIAFLSIEPADVATFLGSLDINRQQRERYYVIICEAFEALTQVVPQAQLGSHDWTVVQDPYARQWRQAPPNAPMQFLNPSLWPELRAQCERVFAELYEHYGRYGHFHDLVNQFSDRDVKPLRDTALVAACFAGGARVSEVLFLSISCILHSSPLLGNSNGGEENNCVEHYMDFGQYVRRAAQERRSQHAMMHDSATDAAHAQLGDALNDGEEGFAQRVVPLAPWAGRLLDCFARFRLAQVRSHEPHQGARSDEQMSSERVLFAARSRPTAAWPSMIMNTATLARSVRGWGERCLGLKGNDHLTAQRLRNTYGAMLIESGVDLNELEVLMGYAPGTVSAWRVQNAWINRH